MIGGCVYVGDCIDVMKEETIQADMCLTAPPYYSEKMVTPGRYLPQRIGQEATVELYIETMVEVFSHVRDCISDKGTVWIILGDACQRLIGVAWMVAFALKKDGWLLLDDYIFNRTLPTHEYDLKREYHHVLTKQHHQILVFAKQQDNKYFEQGLTVSTSHVWTINASRYGGLGCQVLEYPAMPSKLASNCIELGSREGDTVFDPFFGSGTTGKVCKRAGRDYIGIELNPTLEKIQQNRMEG